MLETVLKENNISLYSLAKQTDIPYATLSDIKNGKVSPEHISAGILHSLSLALSVSMDQMYEDLCRPDRLVIKTAADVRLSTRLKNKVEKIRIPIPDYHTEGRFVYNKNQTPAWTLTFTHDGQEQSIIFQGVISNDRYPILAQTGKFIIENYLKTWHFQKLAERKDG